MSPEQRRRTVVEVRRCLGPERVSERRVCRVLGQPRGTQRYARRRGADEAQLLEEMRRISRRRPRFGSPRIHDALEKRGWTVRKHSTIKTTPAVKANLASEPWTLEKLLTVAAAA